MFPSRIIKMVIVFALVCLSADTAHAVVRTWVSSGGSDANPCTRDLPCRNFGAAMTAVDPGGEVVALDSAGYGPVTITKSVAIIAPAGVHAAIAPTSGSAVVINAGLSDSVSLRNLYLNSQGATVGIVLESGQLLSVENVVVAGFTSSGISQATTNSSRLFVSDSILRKNGTGLYSFKGSTPASSAVIRGTSFVANGSSGVFACGDVHINIYDSVAYGNVTAGFHAGCGNAQLNVENSVASGNTYGMYVDVDFATIRVSNCVANNNSSYGFYRVVGTFESRGNNTVRGNTSANTSGTITMITAN